VPCHTGARYGPRWESPKRMLPHDQSPVEEAGGPESADDGCKDQQLAGRELQQHEAPEVSGSMALRLALRWSLKMRDIVTCDERTNYRYSHRGSYPML
jgi:hypothetical protein